MFDCLEVDDGWMERTESSSSWYVHSVFKRVINLVCGQLMVTLATSENTLMPYTLICSADDFSKYKHLERQQVEMQTEHIMIANAFGVYLNGRHVSSQYMPTDMPLETANDKRPLSNIISHIENLYKDQATPGSFISKPDATPFSKEMQRMLEMKTALLCEAVRQRNFVNSTAHAKSLIGLGVGLTPSGDDYLVGFFAVHLLSLKHTEWFKQLVHAVMDNAEQKTNEISATYLKSLTDYRFKAEIVSLIKAVYTQKTAAALTALNALLQVGSTSGSDIAKGMIDAFRLRMVL